MIMNFRSKRYIFYDYYGPVFTKKVHLISSGLSFDFYPISKFDTKSQIQSYFHTGDFGDGFA